MSQPALAPVSPEVKARRKRQNRIIVAIAVAVFVPVLAITGSNKYVDQVMDAWRAHPSFAFNTSSDVDLKSGDYVVWTYFAQASCTVSYAGQPVPTTQPPSQIALESQGIYQSVAFTATAAGTYSVICFGDSSSGFAMVSTPSPIAKAAMVRLLGYFLAGAGIITGIVLFVVALAANANEKKIRSPWPY